MMSSLKLCSFQCDFAFWAYTSVNLANHYITRYFSWSEPFLFPLQLPRCVGREIWNLQAAEGFFDTDPSAWCCHGLVPQFSGTEPDLWGAQGIVRFFRHMPFKMLDYFSCVTDCLFPGYFSGRWWIGTLLWSEWYTSSQCCWQPTQRYVHTLEYLFLV